MNQQHWSLGRKCCVALGCLAVSFPVTLVAQDCPSELNCTVTRECSLQQDTRNCKIKTSQGPEINDPVCEASKAAQNAAYQASKAACEAQKSVDKLSCERAKQQACPSAKIAPNSTGTAVKCSSERTCDVSRSCPLQEDTRSCGHDVAGAHVNDPVCESAKAAQNALYRASKASCEAQKSAANAECESMKEQERLACTKENAPPKPAGGAAQCSPERSCDVSRSCPLQEDTRSCGHDVARVHVNDPVCEAAKAAQNLAYQATKAACESQTAAEKGDCERTKEQERLACEAKKPKG
jgi:hypothetical protein